MVFACNSCAGGDIHRDMKITTVVDLELLRRYGELGQWSTATDLYFNTCLDGLSPAECEALQEAVWARDSAQLTEVVRKAAGGSRLLVSHGRVKPLPVRSERPEAAQAPSGKLS